jgi:hypothetical protein
MIGHTLWFCKYHEQRQREGAFAGEGRSHDLRHHDCLYWAVCFRNSATSCAVIRDGLLPKRAVT